MPVSEIISGFTSNFLLLYLLVLVPMAGANLFSFIGARIADDPPPVTSVAQTLMAPAIWALRFIVLFEVIRFVNGVVLS